MIHELQTSYKKRPSMIGWILKRLPDNKGSERTRLRDEHRSSLSRMVKLRSPAARSTTGLVQTVSLRCVTICHSISASVVLRETQS